MYWKRSFPGRILYGDYRPTLAIRPKFLNGNLTAEMVIQISVRSTKERKTDVTRRAQ